MRKPVFILGFLILVAGCLVGLAVVFPTGGVALPYGFELKYPSVTALLGNEKPTTNADMARTIMLADSLEAADSEEVEQTLAVQHKRVNVDSLRVAEKYLQPIEFSDGVNIDLHKFFAALDAVAVRGGKTHVMHYGDSQIEGDRMTAYIRDRLQKRFGGMGVGLLPASNINAVPIIMHKTSENWHRYPGFINEGEKGGTDKYGVLCSYSTYTPYPPKAEAVPTEAWLRYDASTAIYNNCKSFQQVKVFYGAVTDPVKLTFPVDDTTFSDHFSGKKELNHIALSFNSPRNEVELHFKSNISPQIYAVALEGLSGVQVSNVALRGSSGGFFHNMDNKILGAMFKELNTSLIILQFGGNVLPYMEDEEQVANYGRLFYRQIKLLQAACPEASIVVIGPSDMSTKSDADYVTYPLLEAVRDALKGAAFKADVGYWDMYEAMGGKNSMPAWVAAVPPLAVADHTHFTPRGARIVSEFFYKALMMEYETYQSQKQAIP